MPFPLLYVLYISTFVFVYRCVHSGCRSRDSNGHHSAYDPDFSNRKNSTPFLYQTDPVGTFLCVQFLVIVYYGLLAISNLIEK
jgi:hypothetical protein